MRRRWLGRATSHYRLELLDFCGTIFTPPPPAVSRLCNGPARRFVATIPRHARARTFCLPCACLWRGALHVTCRSILPTALNRSTIFGPAAALQKINGRVRRGLAKQLYDSCPSVDLNKDEHVTTALNKSTISGPAVLLGTIGHPQTGIGALGVVTCGLPRPLTSTTTCGLLFESTTSLQL